MKKGAKRNGRPAATLGTGHQCAAAGAATAPALRSQQELHCLVLIPVCRLERHHRLLSREAHLDYLLYLGLQAHHLLLQHPGGQGGATRAGPPSAATKKHSETTPQVGSRCSSSLTACAYVSVHCLAVCW